jgi:alpha-beta hydrolase superfamily lysophospholipase
MHGKNDRVTSFHACEDFVMNTSETTKLKAWDVTSHELHRDPKNDEVFEYVLGWLQQIGM